MRQPTRTVVSIAAAQVALLWASAARAQETVIVTGQRAALESAQKIKQDADEIVDSVVAEDIGKLPDRSVTEVLQRVVGVQIDRTAARSDPVHYSVEGSGVVIRGLTYVASQLNGRETLSANNGRGLGFEDVPPELMSGVDVYKNPSAEQIEGSIAGLVNLRTALPFDYKGFKASFSLATTYSDLPKNWKPEVSGLVANSWDTGIGRVGALLDLAHAKSSTRTDTITVDPYYRTATFWKNEGGNNYYKPTDDGRWFPRDVSWRSQSYDRTRTGLYGALQWRLNDVESSLTYFRSKFDHTMQEYAVKAEVDPYNIAISDAVYDGRGVMVKGTLRNTSEAPFNGIEVENQTRYMNRNSTTQDLSWNLRWRASENWTFTSDLQLMRSRTQAFDSTVATGVLMPKQTIDLTGSLPRASFDAGDVSYLADQKYYYWATTMEHLDKGTASQKVWRGDARYTFHDSPHLSDLRFGLRFADRDALTVNSNPSYNWAAITKAWQRDWNLGPTWGMVPGDSTLAWVSKYAEPTFLNTFSNFMGGKAAVPGMFFPSQAVARGYPDTYTSLHQHYQDACSAAYYSWMEGWAANGCALANTNPQVGAWKLATFGSDPAGNNDQSERTLAGYTQLRFAFDELPYPVDGNVGLRVVHTRDVANGYTILNVTPPPGGVSGPAGPSLSAFAVAQSFENSYTNALPSLNLRLKARNDLQFRFAWSKAISRPPLDQMQAYTTMDLKPDIDNGTGTIKRWTLSGSALGNPLLKPVQSNQQDATAEWYFSRNGSLTAAVFNKELKDIIVNQTFVNRLTTADGSNADFIVTGPVNGAKGHARGLELAYQQYFDKLLPDWLQGLGVQANYTYVDSKMTRYNSVPSEFCTAGAGADNLNLFINGCDTDGRAFGDTPLPQLSRNTVNLALLYDRGPISARIAYSWRQRYLYGVALNSDNTGPNQQNGLDTNPASATYGRNNLPLGLPLWADSYGQVDAGVQYRFDENLTFSLQGTNLTNSTYKQLMQQHIGMMGHNYFTSGRRYSLSARYTF